VDIDYIKIKNFRQYRNVKIDFARQGSNNWTIIQGANGAGKTNLVNAITWCLFGKELHWDRKYAGLPMVNTLVLDESKGEVVDVEVEIQFFQSDGKRLRVARELHYREVKGKLSETPGPHPPPSLMKETDRDWAGPFYGEDAEFRINNLIPPSIEEYYFFDGERMDDYFKENTGKDIKNAVFEISQLELFKRLIDHLAKRKSEFLRMTKGLSSKAEEMRDALEILTRSRDSDQGQLTKNIEKRDQLELLERDLSEKLRHSSLEHIKNLEERRVSLDDDISQLQGEIEDIEADMIKLLHRNMPIIFAYDALVKTKKLIDVRREAGLIPPLYQAIFIKNLLKKGKCICGNDITDKDEFSSRRRKKVEGFLEESELSDMSSELIESNVSIQEMISGVASFPEEVVALDKKLKAFQETKDTKNEAYRKISDQIKLSNVENVKSWEERRQKYAQEKDELKIQIGILTRDIERRGNIIRIREKELKSELKKEEKHNSLLKLLALCDEGVQAAEQVMNTIMKNVKDEVERRASQQFLSLIWKKNTYKGVAIGDDYNISVPHISGREALGTLSAGERQVCALSFMAALNSVSGFDVPIVIDTPLARISREPRRNIARNLPKYLEGTQVTLLVTEEEYTKEVRNALAEKVGKEYKINFLEKEVGKMAEVELVK